MDVGYSDLRDDRKLKSQALLGILALTLGEKFATTPFKGVNRVATFANVLKHDVTFPSNPSVTRYADLVTRETTTCYLLNRTVFSITYSLCKSAVRKLLTKDEHKRLGSNAGASEIKLHKWFAPINWGLLRNERPPVSLDSGRQFLECEWLRVTPRQIVPAESNGVDAINFRTMRDSKSLDFDTHGVSPIKSSPELNLPCTDHLDEQDVIHAHAGNPSAQEPLTPGISTPKELTGEFKGLDEPDSKEENPFVEFNSVTRHFEEY